PRCLARKRLQILALLGELVCEPSPFLGRQSIEADADGVCIGPEFFGKFMCIAGPVQTTGQIRQPDETPGRQFIDAVFLARE
ncbi:hypothetical protein ACLXNF_23705, partial [Mycobacteroides chelonae]|uniref:hypothetical protein n=1 Tax=Mycobacteroides chelonae TaxID=1774 RepID=UPI0039EBBFBC